MTISHILFQIFIEPLVLLFEVLYKISLQLIGDSALAIIPLSLAVNFLCLPLYLRADEIQKENRAIEKKMEPWVAHIKKHFSGDEQFMMIQAYYRESGYKTTFRLRNSISLLLQIPFFMAAYRVLSNTPYLIGKSIAFLPDLGSPDGLLIIGGVAINLLPIVMTAINLASAFVYTNQDMGKREKVQMIIIAFVFFVLLYNSPSGLVLYWILNQIFSLCKNVVITSNKKFFIGLTKDRILYIVSVALSIGGIALIVVSIAFLILFKSVPILLIATGILMQIPIAAQVRKLKGKKGLLENKVGKKTIFTISILSCITLTVLVGLLIPSALISNSSMEFINRWDYHSPFMHIVNSFLLAFGLFIVWFGVFYYLATDNGKKVIGTIAWILSGCAIANYMFFGTNLGIISSYLIFDNTPSFSNSEGLRNLLVLAGVILVFLFAWQKRKRIAISVQTITVIILIGMFVINALHVAGDMPQINKVMSQVSEEKPTFKLSKEGKNVVVIMLDRAINGFVPYIMNEKPEVAEQFSGFIYYPNTISYGHGTNDGSPGLYGGYEYTPEETNKRKNVLLAEKQNEALKLMPVLFNNAGFDVTITDPPLAGYSDIPDLSIYNDYPGIKAYIIENGLFRDQNQTNLAKRVLWGRNIFAYSLMKILPVGIQPWFYEGGNYQNTNPDGSTYQLVQIRDDRSHARGINSVFVDRQTTLDALPTISEASEEDENHFLMFYSRLAHSPTLLSEPDYSISQVIDNAIYDDEEQESRQFLDGRKVLLTSAFQMSHYHANMAALTELGEWFDYLREQGLFDNTRIIIVSDHGFCLRSFTDMIFGYRTIDDAMWYNAFLMVKDFGSDGDLKTDNTFMTNADTPTLAFDGLIENPVNPFTGNAVNNDKKYEDEHHIFYTDHWQVNENKGTTFLPGDWFTLHGDNLFDMSAWEYEGYY